MKLLTDIQARIARSFSKVGRADPVYVVSYPKCGRTWLRYMLEGYVEEVAGIAAGRIAEGGQALKPRAKPHPAVYFRHDDAPDQKRPEELTHDKSHFAGKRVVFLVRDPRDVVVSIYFEKVKRSHLYSDQTQVPGAPDDLVGPAHGGLETIVSYYNIWWDNRDLPAEFLVMRYEDLLADPNAEFQRFCEFCGYPVDKEAIQRAVAAADFSSMRRLEETGGLSYKLAPGDPGDPESFKTRRGEAGAFADYLSPAQVEAATRRVREDLAPNFGYPLDAAAARGNARSG